MNGLKDPFSPPELNSEIFVIPVEAGSGTFLIYAPLRRSAFITDRNGVEFLNRLRCGGDTFDKTIDGSFLEVLKRLEIVGSGAEEYPVTHYRGDPNPTSITLFLTTACNLRCTYCYASAGETPLNSMSREVARHGIDFIAANARDRGAQMIEISYHGGGEPSVNFATMKDSHEYALENAKKLGLRVRATTATNGVMSPKIRDWIIENLDGASLSFDGLPEVQDLHRPTVSGKGSSGKVIETLKAFDEAGFPYGIRITVSHDVIGQLPNSVEYICSQFNPQRIQAEPAYQIGRGAGKPSAETEKFIESYLEAARIARRYGLELGFSAARLDSLSNHFCGVTQDSFALSTKGEVSACYESFSKDVEWSEKFFYGTPAESGYRFDLGVLDHLRNRTVDRNPYCQGCFAKWSCAGDCYYKSITVQGGDTEFSGTERCDITREILKDMLLNRISDSGGLFWHELSPEKLEELELSFTEPHL